MITLLHGDCLEKMAEIPDGSVDLTVTSPPYDNLRTYEGTLNWNEDIWKQVLEQLYRVTKQGGVVVWVVGDATIKGSETGTSFKQALYAKEIGFNLHDTMIWDKGCFTAPCVNRYGNVFEYMFILSKGSPKSSTLIQDRRNKKAGQKIYGTKREADGSMKMTSKHGTVRSDYGQRFNIWSQPCVQSHAERTEHPAQFPLKLAHDHILSWSNKGDTVLDPFMGSGTTGVACLNTNRSFIGIEKNLSYFNLATDRIRNTQPPLLPHI